MRTRKVLLDSDAKSDLRAIHRWIVTQGAPKTASAYIRRIQKFVGLLKTASERGIPHHDLVAGLRMIPFESVMLAVRVEERTVVVLRIFHSAQDWAHELREYAEDN